MKFMIQLRIRILTQKNLIFFNIITKYTNTVVVMFTKKECVYMCVQVHTYTCKYIHMHMHVQTNVYLDT